MNISIHLYVKWCNQSCLPDSTLQQVSNDKTLPHYLRWYDTSVSNVPNISLFVPHKFIHKTLFVGELFLKAKEMVRGGYKLKGYSRSKGSSNESTCSSDGVKKKSKNM